MSDLFHDQVPIDFIARVFGVMARPLAHLPSAHEALEAARQDASELDWPANVWMGVSVENDRYCFRADHLAEVPATVRFLSVRAHARTRPEP